MQPSRKNRSNDQTETVVRHEESKEREERAAGESREAVERSLMKLEATDKFALKSYKSFELYKQ